MSTRTKYLLQFMQVLTWIGFIGICVKAGALLVSYFISMFVNPIASQNLMLGLNLSDLMEQDKVHYSALALSLVILTIFEAALFYTVIQIFLKINYKSPFDEVVGKLIQRMGGLSLIIGLQCKMLSGYVKGYTNKGMNFPNLSEHIGIGNAFLFFAGVLFIISLLYTKGIELQKESELTV